MTATYIPPDLPPYLANTFNLGSITGAPTDEEVKVIHSVIRVVDSASHIPALFDPALSMALANHLFEVQMARYNSRYPFSIFTDVTYTPPELPSHMNILLEPVVVAPSDDQIRMAQVALRFVDSMASAPSMYDADLSMRLSQHLFDIQLARFVQRSSQIPHTTQAQAAPEVPSVLPGEGRHPIQERALSPTSADPIPEERLVPQGDQRDIQGLEPGSDPEPGTQIGALDDLTPPSDQLLDSQGSLENGEGNSQRTEVKELLIAINETLMDLRRTMIVTHNCMARGLANYSKGLYPSIINTKGEDPRSYDIKRPGYLHWNMDEANLARFLRYYGIGDEFFEEGSELILRSGVKNEAFTALSNYVYCR